MWLTLILLEDNAGAGRQGCKSTISIHQTESKGERIQTVECSLEEGCLPSCCECGLQGPDALVPPAASLTTLSS